jgi:hypothetical protein
MEANKVICFQSNFSVKKSFGLKKQAMYRVLILIGLLNLSFSLYSQDISFYNTEFILLYQHKENHLKIMVEGYECKDIVVEVNEGKIQKEGVILFLLAIIMLVMFIFTLVKLKEEKQSGLIPTI